MLQIRESKTRKISENGLNNVWTEGGLPYMKKMFKTNLKTFVM